MTDAEVALARETASRNAAREPRDSATRFVHVRAAAVTVLDEERATASADLDAADPTREEADRAIAAAVLAAAAAKAQKSDEKKAK